MVNMRSFCFTIAFQNISTLKYRLTDQCPSLWLVVMTMKFFLPTLEKIYIGYWPVQINGNKFATDQILKKLVEVVKGGF
jgi:hypothetical protein